MKKMEVIMKKFTFLRKKNKGVVDIIVAGVAAGIIGIISLIGLIGVVGAGIAFAATSPDAYFVGGPGYCGPGYGYHYRYRHHRGHHRYRR